jgi:hypothetical protein
MCLIGLAHCAARGTGDPATVPALADAAIERLRAVSNRAVLVQALERYSDAVEILGDAGAAERLRGQRAALVAQYGLPESRWRPAIATAPPYLGALPEVDTLFTTETGSDRDGSDTALSMTQSLAHIEGYLPEHVKAR